MTVTGDAGSDGFVETRQRGQVSWVHRDLGQVEPDALWAPLASLPGAKGRGGVGLLELGGRMVVVRPYRRGGALGSVLKDRYSSSQRAHEELLVLARLQQEGVPVVTPLAAAARRSGAFWRLRLFTLFEADALPLPAFLAAHPQRRRFAAEAVGLVVRLAFAAGLRHPDLHLDNVLCRPAGDKVRAVLVDLDRARLAGPPDEAARDEMLVRMARYVVRHRSELAAVPSNAEAMRFLGGLGLPRAERHTAWRRLTAALGRSLRRRDWLRGQRGGTASA